MDEASTAFMVAETMDNIRRLFQAVNEQSKLAERETGLTWPQVWAIRVIATHAPIRVSDLAKKMYLHPATVVGILDRLEKRGYVFRTRSSGDRRVVDVDLTPDGYSLFEHSPEVASNMITHGLEALPRAELAEIHGGLQRLVQILAATELPPKLVGASVVNVPERPTRGRAARLPEKES